MGWLAVAVSRAQALVVAVVDVAGARDAAPALLVGWCVGRASAAVLEPGTVPPAAAGVVAGCSAAGAVVLSSPAAILAAEGVENRVTRTSAGATGQVMVIWGP